MEKKKLELSQMVLRSAVRKASPPYDIEDLIRQVSRGSFRTKDFSMSPKEIEASAGTVPKSVEELLRITCAGGRRR
jgi:hypothetical protein